MDRIVHFKQEEITGHETQMGLDIKTDRLTDRQLQYDFDLNTYFESSRILQNPR
jgi:hypothetical protein